MAHPVKEVLAKAANLVSAFRLAGLPVVIVHVNPMGADWTKTRVDKPLFPQNTVVQTVMNAAMPITGFADIVPEITVKPTDISIEKKTWNAFYGTSLHEQLQRLKVTGIVLGGVSTSVGVEGTARAASELGYNISIASDATTDKQINAYNHSITYILPQIAEVGTTQDVLSKLPVGK